MKELISYKDLYRKELLDYVIPFWEEKSPDTEYGGYFTCLDRQGNVFDSDKFVWLQARQVWLFSMMYNEVEKRQSWLDMALLGARFLEKYGRDANGNWYFSLTREGKPLVQPYCIFSACFSCMAYAELYKATGETAYKDIAMDTYRNIQARSENPKGIYNKLYPGTRPMKGISLPMIMCNVLLILEEVIGSDEVDKAVNELIHEVMDVFYHKEYGVIMDQVAPDGSFVDCFEGRVTLPGHTSEIAWFMMDIAKRNGDRELIQKSVDRLLFAIEYGWDKKYEGLFYFMDVKGYPMQQLQWDQKLWWVHIETLVALAKGYQLTGDNRCKEWFMKMHDYTWSHFRDPEYPEWYGYLNRQGEQLFTLKGGKWKGCFHVPRGLYQVWKALEADS